MKNYLINTLSMALAVLIIVSMSLLSGKLYLKEAVHNPDTMWITYTVAFLLFMVFYTYVNEGVKLLIKFIESKTK